MSNRYSSQRGFTLVELTIVIVILAILSIYAASRFQGASSFSPYAAQSQAISVIRQIQLARMQSNTGDDESYQLQVSPICLGAKIIIKNKEGEVVEEKSACNGDESLSSKVEVDGQDLKFTLSPNNGDIQFDLLGRPLPLTTSGNAKTGSEYTITITATGNNVEGTNICINSEGYVSGGDCK